VKLLLDTQVLLWHLDASETLSREYLARLSGASDVVISAASLWEIAIKRSKGKLTVPDNLPVVVRNAGMRVLQVTAAHAWRVRDPPASLATADPFDRLIYAQASLEGFTLATRDRALLASGLAVIAA
jgi:PIN domain nuclease of toxin-antitoxin system